MDSPSDRFLPFQLYSAPPEPHPLAHPLFPPLTPFSSATQRWGGVCQRPPLFSALLLEEEKCQDHASSRCGGRSRAEGGRREGRRRQRRELKLQLEETQEKLLELQRRVWRVYGEEEAARAEGGGASELIRLEEVSDERVWLGCSLVRGEWAGPGQKLAEALKQELAGVVARVIDRVVRMYVDTLPGEAKPDEARPFLPQTPGPALLPDTPVTLPLLHYTMQNLLARSFSALPPPKHALAKPFLDLRDPGSAFPLLDTPDPARDGGMRGGADGLDAALYLSAGASQEGLSPCHLKKAKLMFFYTRYPSSSTLKIYFPDVKFSRCVTSQLIKWFSNFREFFYIQMERFARQAVRESLVSVRERVLRVSRESEVFRILNMHYNKSNDYQVPDRFVEVSEVALREFFSAIHCGRDGDPCWKKSIYKTICKLDGPVPDSFRLPGCPADPHRP